MPFTKLMSASSNQLWVDVKVMSTKPNKPIKHLLCQTEVVKCKQSRTSASQHPTWVQHRLFGWNAWASCSDGRCSDVLYIITRQATVIEERQGCTPSSALRQASGQFWEPLSSHLLIAGWLSIVHRSWPGLCRVSDTAARCTPARGV